MIDYSEYVRWYERQKIEMMDSGVFGSEPTFLFSMTDERFADDFDYWEFNPDNWCGGDILRNFIYDTFYDNINIEGMDIKRYRIDDSWYVFIFTETSFYQIKWYKSRGNTERIAKDGDLISLKEYIDLCNLFGIKLD